MNKILSDHSGANSLGSGNTDYAYMYKKELLERIANPSTNNDFIVTLECLEFTALCPKTGQPDFAMLYIEYSPASYLVESKSLKLYLGSFRQTGVFHEHAINIIADDLFGLLSPKYIKVKGDFSPRGGIKIIPTATRGDKPPA